MAIENVPQAVRERYSPHEIVTHEQVKQHGEFVLWRTTQHREHQQLPDVARYHITEAGELHACLMPEDSAALNWEHLTATNVKEQCNG